MTLLGCGGYCVCFLYQNVCDNRETFFKIAYILFTFTLVYTTQTIYQWYQHYFFVESSSKNVNLMLKYQGALMNSVWITLPLFIVFMQHHINSKQ